MREGTKLLGILAALAWFSSGTKKTTPEGAPKADSSTQSDPAPVTPPKKKKPTEPKKPAKEPKRPEAAKPEPGPPVDLTPDHDEEAPKTPKQEEKKPATPAKKGDKKPAQADAEPSPDDKKANKPARDKEKADRDKEKADRDEARGPFVDDWAAEYELRGFFPEKIAAECLTLYMMAGGSSPSKIKAYQKGMGLEETGEYDKETSNYIAKDIGMAIDGAIMRYLSETQHPIHGEDPHKAAGMALVQYIEEAESIGEVLPPEKIMALQRSMGMGAKKSSGKYDQNTIDRLIELGVL